MAIAVAYPEEEPSRRARAIAGCVLVVGGFIATRKLKEPARAAVRLASPLLLEPLALWLTRMGF